MFLFFRNYYYFNSRLSILILDYVSEIKIFKEKIFEIAFAVLTLLTGGIGFSLFLEAFLIKFPFLISCNHCLLVIIGILLFPIGGFVSFTGFLYDLFFWDIASKACRIAFPISYFVSFSCFQIITQVKNCDF